MKYSVEFNVESGGLTARPPQTVEADNFQISATHVQFYNTTPNPDPGYGVSDYVQVNVAAFRVQDVKQVHTI